MKRSTQTRRAHGLRRQRACERLEDRHMLSAVAFEMHDVIHSETRKPTAAMAADMDGDGDHDVVSASQGYGRILLYKNADGLGTFASPTVVASGRHAIGVTIDIADIDGDVDLDVVVADTVQSVQRWPNGSWNYVFDTHLTWYENLDGAGNFSEGTRVAAKSNDIASFHAADMDADGDADLLYSSSPVTAWYENTDGLGDFGEEHIISTQKIGEVFPADLDGDLDMDLVITGGPISWIENDGTGNFGEPRDIALESPGPWFVHAADIDGDDDLDVLMGKRDLIAWYENTDGLGSFGTRTEIAIRPEWVFPQSVDVMDLDGDGDNDAIASWGDGRIEWYQNTDGRGDFAASRVISRDFDGSSPANPFTVSVADLDGDGDPDLLSASADDDKIAWFANTDGLGTFGDQIVISKLGASGARDVSAADVDADGDPDLLFASSDDDTIGWYENVAGSFTSRQLLTSRLDGARSVFAADIDGDDDLDVLSSGANRLEWYENTDGQGIFGDGRRIESQGADVLFVVDVDGDADLDVVSKLRWPHEIVWYENTDGKGRFAQKAVLADAGENSRGAIYPTDVDGDGDIDVLYSYRINASPNLGKILWYQNDGVGNFVERSVADSKESSLAVVAADVDGDHDMDVVATSRPSSQIGTIFWYENTDGQGSFAEPKLVSAQIGSSSSILGVSSLRASDVDLDGDLDVVAGWGSGFFASFDGTITWHENIDGKGTFGDAEVISDLLDGDQVAIHIVDVEGDGDIDVLSASDDDDRIAWFENRLAGDIDDDGAVGFSDFLILSSGFGRDTDGGSDAGDLDSDGKVSFADFLMFSANFGNVRPQPSASPAKGVVPKAEIGDGSEASLASTDAVFAEFNAPLAPALLSKELY